MLRVDSGTDGHQFVPYDPFFFLYLRLTVEWSGRFLPRRTKRDGEGQGGTGRDGERRGGTGRDGEGRGGTGRDGEGREGGERRTNDRRERQASGRVGMRETRGGGLHGMGR
jgi:hypothetical protein